MDDGSSWMKNGGLEKTRWGGWGWCGVRRARWEKKKPVSSLTGRYRSRRVASKRGSNRAKKKDAFPDGQMVAADWNLKLTGAHWNANCEERTKITRNRKSKFKNTERIEIEHWKLRCWRRHFNIENICYKTCVKRYTGYIMWAFNTKLAGKREKN